MVDRLPLVRQLTKRAAPAGVGRKSPVVRLFPQRWKYPNGPYTGREEKMIVWRNDMPEFMLARLRSEAIKLIKSASDAFKRSDVPNGVWTSVDMEEYSEAALDEGLDYLEPIAHMGRGAVLVLGERQPDHDVKAESQGSSTDIALQESDVEEVESGSQDSSTDKPLQEGGSVEAVPESQDPSTDTELQEGSPEEARSELQDTEVNLDSTDAVCVSDALPEYVTLPQTQSKVPVFELLELFSDEEMDELRSYHPRFNSPALFFRPTDKLTVNTMLALWKLKGYIRQDNAST
ncbi:hypothetical protein BDV25DRAFT_157885 [Aspergillus avenaceus]|uniref:Uncharacterized protein n=1 Tax=Aspergillus avenaceus TaxID=36643 RepID=A0A5N6TQW0_ASPAV|nr:hypothetical protein BDV25DRAFT_157885 [Aspergillus avenaceus]